jgi:glycosyltransferase involved in cell wall biosynthesis/GT2 family glycosyltransferase
MPLPAVSVVICTYNRVDSLRLALESLRQQTYRPFEIVVVCGPCTDRTEEMLGSFGDDLKVLHNEQPNLSVSRNFGIAAAGGDIVAFLDDDAVADPTWLEDLVPEFDDDEVAAVGGPVLDYTGIRFQVRYNLADRWGDARVELEPMKLEYLNHPDTWQFAYTIGTNSLFRRRYLVGIGGFDENYAFYLDETDVCLRLIDSGYRVVPKDRGIVHHKFLPSTIRNEHRVTVDRFDVVMSRVYFSLRNGLPRSNEVELTLALAKFIEHHRRDLAMHIAAGRIPPAARDQFDHNAAEAFTLARVRASEPARTHDEAWFRSGSMAFRPLPVPRPLMRRLRVAIVSHDYPPGVVHGIARASQTLAEGLVAAGHIVHVVAARSGGHSTVDLENGVWVHRIVTRPQGPPPVAGLRQSLWDRAGSVRDEIERIHDMTPIDYVHTPNWDVEGLALILDGRLRTVLFAHTPHLAVAEHDPRIDASDAEIAAIAEAERVAFESAHVVMVSFPSTVEELFRLYGLSIPAGKLAVVPESLPDMAQPAGESTEDHRAVEILFVGRLEARKGIDTLLSAIPIVCARSEEVHFTLVGDDSITTADGRTYRHAFEEVVPASVASRVTFTGPIPDADVLAHYATCDVFVSPSRFESFGLTILEAMRFAKAIVSTTANGVSSVVRDGVDGILVPPDDPAALAAGLVRLIEDSTLRRRMGTNGRESFEANFSVGRMIERVEAVAFALVDGRPQDAAHQAQAAAAVQVV